MAGRSPYATLLERVPVCRAEVELPAGLTRYRVYGTADAPAVVALHGLRGEHHGFEPIVAHLGGCRVVVPDFPGFGESPPLTSGSHDVAGYAAWARDFVTAVAPRGQAVLLGHSFGSVVAAAAVADGLPVRGLVLVNPIACSPLAGPRVVLTALTVGCHHLAAALPQRWGEALLRSRIATRIVSTALVKTPDRTLRRWIHAEHDRYFATFADRRVVLEAFHAAVAHDVGEFAGRVGVPTLLVAAERDDLGPLPAQHALAGRFGAGRLVVVPGVGHLAHYEAPAPIARALARFVAALPVP